MKTNLAGSEPPTAADFPARPSAAARRRRQVVLVGLILTLGAFFGGGQRGGCSRDDSRAQVYIALSPVAVVLPVDKVRSAAEYYARLRPNSAVLDGYGAGMMPLYAPGTLVVVERIPYDQLKEGMTAVFIDGHGQRAAHFLVRLQIDGWTTRGLNQGREDPNPMIAQNYLGVIVMAFSPEGEPPAD